MEHSARVQGADVGLLEHNFLQSMRPYNGSQLREFIKEKGTGDFKDDVFLEEMHSLKAQKHFSPLFACQKLIGGLTVAPHGDGFFLKESRIQKMIFSVGQMPAA